MNTIHLTDQELKTARNGMTAFLQGFTHHEPEVHQAIRAVLAQLDAAQTDDSTAVVG
jgi:hypothetical protein